MCLHFMCVLSTLCVSFVCPTLCGPMGYNPPGSSAHGILRQESWSELPFPSPGDVLIQGLKTVSPTSPALAGRFFTTIRFCAIWEASRISVLISMYSWPLDNRDLNCRGPLTRGIFLIANPTVLHHLHAIG